MFIVTILYLFLPLVLLVVYSFNDSKTLQWTGLSLRWYKELFFESASLWKAFGNSLVIAVTSAAIATVIGTLAGIGIKWYE